MISIGDYNTLTILRETSVGLYLGNEEGEEILLPNKYVPETYEIGDELSVFCYLDHEERPVATNIKPFIKLGEFALLRVTEVSKFGAFLDWGLEKNLLVPYSEQTIKMSEGKWYLVYLYLDETTNRLVATTKINNFLSNDELTIEKFEEVDLLVSRFTDIGIEVIINQKHKGLVYNNEVFEDVAVGDKRRGVVKKIREDHKIDVSFQQLGFKNIEPSAEKILSFLEKNNGFLGLHDKSDPEDIEAILGMSKKSFKKAIGNLYKEKKIQLTDAGIRLITK